jgi:hypothetical protein
LGLSHKHGRGNKLLNQTTPNFQTIEENDDSENGIGYTSRKKIIFSSGSMADRSIDLAEESKRYLEDAPAAAYQHSDILVPLVLRNNEFLDPHRVVLYREDCREIPYVLPDN